MIVKEYSWTILDENRAVKKTDKSSFEHGGSTIPRGIYYFFNVTDMKQGERREILLTMDDMNFPAYFTREKHELRRIRLFWGSKLSKHLQDIFKDFKTYKKEDYPELVFRRLSDVLYSVYLDSDTVPVGSDTILLDDIGREDVFKSYADGKKTQSYVTKYERNFKNRENAIKAHGRSCMICGFNFEESYGDPGKGFIEVHHRKPVSEYEGELLIDPVQDLACLCSNCHRMIHRNRNKTLSVEELREYYDKAHRKKQTSEKSNYNEPPSP